MINSPDPTDLYRSNLLSTGLVTKTQIDHAYRASEKTGVPVGEIFIGLGLLTPQEVAAVTSKTWNTPSVNLQEEIFDEKLVKQHSGQMFINEMWMPIRELDDNHILVATVNNPSQELLKNISSTLGGNKTVTAVITTSWDLRRKVMAFYHEEIAYDASMALWNASPKKSARVVLTLSQKIIFSMIALLILTSAIIYPLQTLAGFITVTSLAFLVSILFKYRISLAGAKLETKERITKSQINRLVDAELPIYTVLVPVYKEANIVGQLVKNLGDIDYPKNKLEVLILIEEDDDETREALEKSSPPDNFHVIIVPDGNPRTKPRACNVGLYLASGEYVVIYDAEDRPDPDQLKKAVIAFRKGSTDLICVQASLNYFNDQENFLTRMFSLEYSYWFDYMLTGLERLNLPIPLGGTSNHFKTEPLVALGGWDTWNVTEDADLGIRAAALGYTVGTINSTTMEEANTSIPNFIRQRSRWIKGYLQTLLVHLREPMKLLKATSLRQILSFLLLIGGTPVTFLAVIPLYIFSLIALFADASFILQFLPQWVVLLSLFNFFIGNLMMIHLSMMGPFKRHRYKLVFWAFFNPIYWLLHSVASYKAVWQLIFNPHYWEKTLHGLTKEEDAHNA